MRSMRWIRRARMPPGPNLVQQAYVSPPRNGYRSTNRCGLGRPPLLGDVHRQLPPRPGRDALPEPDEAVGRHEDDEQEDDPDQRVETLGDQVDVLRVVVDEHED